MKPKTLRPQMGGLTVVPTMLNQLHGERHDIELPVPRSAIYDHATKCGFNDVMVSLVQRYDLALMRGRTRTGENADATS